MEIKGKRVLVTGAGRGLGRAIVEACANAEAKVIFAGVRKKQDHESLRSAFTNVSPVQLDITNDADVDALGQLDTVDILINNAGVAGYGNPLTVDIDSVRTEWEVNYFGTLRVIRALAPGMIKQQNGMIVNVATVFAKVNLPLVGSYCATKSALLSLGQALRAYLTEFNVKLITVMPTTIDTDMSRGANVPKMTTKFVAGEILEAIREEKHDPPIGDEARDILAALLKDPLALEKSLMQYK